MSTRIRGALTELHKETTTVEGVNALALDGRLPDYVKKLIQGYDLRVYWFELFECLRKILLVGMPVFFEVGSVAQLTFGLVICFISFGAYNAFTPYKERNDDRLAQLCQVQIFFALVSSIILRYTEDATERTTSNLDILLCTFTFLPLIVAFVMHVLEEGLADYFMETCIAPMKEWRVLPLLRKLCRPRRMDRVGVGPQS